MGSSKPVDLAVLTVVGLLIFGLMVVQRLSVEGIGAETGKFEVAEIGWLDETTCFVRLDAIGQSLRSRFAPATCEALKNGDEVTVIGRFQVADGSHFNPVSVIDASGATLEDHPLMSAGVFYGATGAVTMLIFLGRGLLRRYRRLNG